MGGKSNAQQNSHRLRKLGEDELHQALERYRSTGESLGHCLVDLPP